MWSFEILDKMTGERDLIFGYNLTDACKRHNIDKDTIEVLREDYED